MCQPVAFGDHRFICGHDMLMMSLMHVITGALNLSFVSPQSSTYIIHPIRTAFPIGKLRADTRSTCFYSRIEKLVFYFIFFVFPTISSHRIEAD